MAIKAKISKIVKISLVLLLGIGIGIVGAAFLINKPFAKETETDVLANSEGKATKEKKVDKSNVTRTGYVVSGECTNLYLTKRVIFMSRWILVLASARRWRRSLTK